MAEPLTIIGSVTDMAATTYYTLFLRPYTFWGNSAYTGMTRTYDVTPRDTRWPFDPRPSLSSVKDGSIVIYFLARCDAMRCWRGH